MECCGLLIGTPAGIESVHRAENVRESPMRYLVRPDDHFRAIRLARARGLEVIGAYHSHPSGRPRPSATDRDEAQGEDFLYVIAGTCRLRRAWWHRRRRTSRGAGARRGRAVRDRSHPRSVQVAGHWIVAWRLVAGNFSPVSFVRLP